MAVTAHVDLCTNRSGLDNSTHQSRRHNPFLKDRTNGRQQSGQTAQHRKTKKNNNNTVQQDTKKHKTQQIKDWRPMEKVAKTCKSHGQKEDGRNVLSRRSPLSQRQFMLMQRPLLQVNCVRGKHVGYAGNRVQTGWVPKTLVAKYAQIGEVDQPQEAGSSDRSPQSSSRSHVQEIGMQRPLAHEYWLGGQVRAGKSNRVKDLPTASPDFDFSQMEFVSLPEQVVLDSSSSFPQSLSPSHSQRSGMQRLFLHLNLSVGQVCWSGGAAGWNNTRGANEGKRKQTFSFIL